LFIVKAAFLCVTINAGKLDGAVPCASRQGDQHEPDELSELRKENGGLKKIQKAKKQMQPRSRTKEKKENKRRRELPHQTPKRRRGRLEKHGTENSPKKTASATE
jgi:hypothetical protein